MSHPCPDPLPRTSLTRALRSLLVLALAVFGPITLARAECGDALVDGSEQCDGPNLGGTSCAELGFAGGTLKCNLDCTFNTSECQVCPEDADGDGFQTANCGGSDCNDHDPLINPDAPDLCNGLDDDCDPASADGSEDPQVGVACDGVDSDLCLEGTTSCTGATIICSDNTVEIRREFCNGLDDDCDPATPDGSGEPSIGAACDGPDSDLCNEGTRICTAGAIVCSDITGNTLDVCDGLDNDCDPASVDGSEDPLTGALCDGLDSDLCPEGTRFCVAGIFNCSDNSSGTLDVCNGFDDDCDPASPDGSEDPLTGAPCDGPDSDLCNEGTRFCSAGVIVCSDATGNTIEVCGDGLDNDCNGLVDEGCGTCGNGVVDAGESCDGLDLNGQNCVSFGYTGGVLACDAACSFDTSGCTVCPDADGDGFSSADCGGPDCNDHDPLINPAAPEICNGMDDNCDFRVDEACAVCGNGIREPGEECDDANTVSGDGCSATCKIEQACPPDRFNCHGVCVDPSTDPDNCSACDFRCLPGDRCDNGACRGTVCPQGTTLCGTQCFDLSSDPRNCGDCGRTCAQGEACVNATCQTPSSCTDGVQNGSETGVDCGGGACPACPVDVCISSMFGDPGQRVSVPITLGSGGGVAGFQVDIHFDATLLNTVTVGLGTDTPAADGWFIFGSGVGLGTLRILGHSNPPTGLGMGPREVALVDFEIAGGAPLGAVSPFGLDNCVLSDAQGVQIPCNSCPQPGRVTVRPASSFSFRPIDSPVGVDQFDPLPFLTTVDALTFAGLPATGYSGTAAMSVGPLCAGTLRPASLGFSSGFGSGSFEVACCLDPLLPMTLTTLSLEATDPAIGLFGTSAPIVGVAKADVNADDAVNILDVIPAIYLSLDISVAAPPPAPPASFQRWAANMLDQHCAVDAFINVLDVVRIRNKALRRPPLCRCQGFNLQEQFGQASVLASPPGPISIKLEKDGPKDFLVKVQGAVDLSGLQIELKGAGPKARVSLEGLTAGRSWQASTTLDQGVLRVVAFSNAFTGISGDGVVLRITGGGTPRLVSVVASDTEGREIPAK